jgi:hypothetical protein
MNVYDIIHISHTFDMPDYLRWEKYVQKGITKRQNNVEI